MKDPRSELILFKANCKGDYPVKEILISAQAMRVNKLDRQMIRLASLPAAAANDRCVYILFRTQDLAYGGLVNAHDLYRAMASPAARDKYLSIGVFNWPQSELKSLCLMRENNGYFRLIFQARDFTSLKARLKPAFTKLIMKIAAAAPNPDTI
ncbi:MAG: hypothetical protein MUC28_04175 [Planctomycetes bacterium]|nr:hypothetical protein [Planctomycetota bacterium]